MNRDELLESIDQKESMIRLLQREIDETNEGLIALNLELEGQIEERRKAEKELERHRDYLEDMVKERTAELAAANEKLKDEIGVRRQVEKKIMAQLREKEILLREVHHRVKNNMQIIESLFKLQSRHVDDEKVREILGDAGNRIRTMALIHEKLYRSTDLAEIEIKDYIGLLVKGLYQAYRVDPERIRPIIECEDVTLDINTAIPFGLIINEIMTNTIKHAFPGDRRGDMRLYIGETETGEYTATISDNGIGIAEDIDPATTGSLGLHLIDILIRDQLGGEYQIARSSGTTYHIKFRAEE